ncbi:MAG: hypothetical protein IT324_18255 [Anaerolineae bacterium]|nr:hypothetical protein [Anaerolineae bacterium]
MDVQTISFVLALVVGGLCFALVKHTADEFDRWYEEPAQPARRVPTALISTLIVSAVAFLLHLTH